MGLKGKSTLNLRDRRLKQSDGREFLFLMLPFLKTLLVEFTIRVVFLRMMIVRIGT